jgi:tRNA A-37 threonylcarbamoyl transferase component Bud32
VAEDPSGRGRRLLAALAPGTRVAGYLLQSPVGAGGMAAVYRAHDEPLDRVVALKLVYAGEGIDQVVRERFVREALSVAKVDHPHIIPVYAAGEADDVLFIAMRYVAGGDLRAVVSCDGSLLPARVAAVISPVASALDTAHESGLVHRDVKPANILVDPGRGRRPDHVYLSDFGLARGVLSVGGLTQDGQFVGTPDYASPEQIKGHLTDGQADQYSLACVAYTLLTGLVPYVRENPMAVLYAQLDEPPPRATAVRPDLPRAVDRVLAKAMAKAPGKRYDSCGAFADALREALGVGPYDPTGPIQRPAGADTGTSAVSYIPGPAAPRYESTITDIAANAAQARDAAVNAGDPAAGVAVPTAKMTVPLDQPYPYAQPATPRQAAAPQVSLERSGTAGGRAGTARTGEWTAVVTADRVYYDSVQAANEQDAAAIHFPGRYDERRIRLAGAEMTIGRRSRSRHIEPDIDLTGDPGVSRLHATLTARPDGGWSIADKGTPNGTLLNGSEIASGQAMSLRDGDHVNLGAWTRITIVRG